MHLLRRGLAVVALAALALTGLAVVPPVPEAGAAGTLAWPHFIKIHVQNRRADTRIIVDAAYAGVRWVSHPGVAAGDHLIRLDQNGFVRSLDGTLAFWRQPPQGNGLQISIQSPGRDGFDTFRFDPAPQPMRYLGETFAGTPGNTVTDVAPYIPTFSLPLDFEINVGGMCRPNQYLQVAPEWTNTVWRTPDGTGPGTYRVRLNTDFSVTSLDGKTAFSQIPAQPWDHGNQLLGVLIVHSCDPAGDGADISGYDRLPDGKFRHMTTWAQTPDGGYGWQPYNCGQNGACNSQPRESLAGGNYIVLSPYTPPAPPLNLAPTRLTGGSLPAVSVATSKAQFPSLGAGAAVLARVDAFADALAGVPLALTKNGPLLLTPSSGLDAEVAAELTRAVRPLSTVYLLGGTAALSPAVEQAVAAKGYTVRRIAGPTRMETAVAVAGEVGPASNAFVVNAWNFPDALAAGPAAGAVPGGAHILLTDTIGVPPATQQRLASGGYSRRYVFGGNVVVSDATYAALGAHERVAGWNRDATAAAAASRFFPGAGAVWVAAGNDYVGGIAGGAMAGARKGPLLLVSGALGDEARAYLEATKPAAGYVMAALPDTLVRSIFTQSAR